MSELAVAAMAETDAGIIETYQAGDEAREALHDANIIALAGISGAGKDTIARNLAGVKGGYHVMVSYTTRKRRVNDGVEEQEGIDYHFVDVPQMAALARSGKLVEVKGYSGKYYGTSVTEVEDAHAHHQTAVAVIEIQGVETIRALAPRLKAFFVIPPDFRTWMNRYSQRAGGHVDDEERHQRMVTARNELRHVLSTPDGYHLVVNDELEAAVGEIDGIAKGDAKAAEKAAKEATHARDTAEMLLARLEVALGEPGARLQYAQLLGRSVLRRLSGR